MTYVRFTSQTGTALDMRGNFHHIRLGHFTPMGDRNTFAATTGVFNLGIPTLRFDKVYLSSDLFIDGSSTMEDFTGNTLTSIGASLTALVLAASATVVWGATSSYYVAGTLNKTGVNNWHRKIFATNAALSTSGSFVQAHGIASGTDKIMRVRMNFHASTGRVYQLESGPKPTTTVGGDVTWDDTYVYYPANTATFGGTITVNIDYIASGGLST